MPVKTSHAWPGNLCICNITSSKAVRNHFASASLMMSGGSSFTTSTEGFRAFVRTGLCPTLRPGDLVVMGNLSPHKNDLTLGLIEQAGATVCFLPAYSADLNPIEKMWSKVKQFLRCAEARTGAELLAAIAAALPTVTRQAALNWFASCGYSFI